MFKYQNLNSSIIEQLYFNNSNTIFVIKSTRVLLCFCLFYRKYCIIVIESEKIENSNSSRNNNFFLFLIQR